MVADALRARAADVRRAAWPLLQGTVAATTAWVIARHVFDHHEPFFAPVAAVVALNASLGERGLNAVRLLQGVVVGILVGETALAVVGSGPLSLALAMFAAMAVAVALGGARIVIAQAAVSAILCVVIGDAEAGAERLVDALVGGGVALAFSQLLFSPEPVALLRRAEAVALAGMARGLEQASQARERDDDELAERALQSLRVVRDHLAELARVRRASTRVARRSAVWRSQRAPVVRENENAGQLDLLGGSCLTLARALAATSEAEGSRFAPIVRDLADVLGDLAAAPGDRATRQRAADRALAVVRRLDGTRTPSESTLTAGIVEMVAGDIMVFAGVDPEQAADAVRDRTAELDISSPAPAPRVPFLPGQRKSR